MQSMISVRFKQAATADAKGRTLGISVELLAASSSALHGLRSWDIGRAVTTAFIAACYGVIDSGRRVERIHGHDLVDQNRRADGTLGCRYQQRSPIGLSSM